MPKKEILNLVGKIKTVTHPNIIIKILDILNGYSGESAKVEVSDYLGILIKKARKGDEESCSIINWLIQGDLELQKKTPQYIDTYEGLLQIIENRKYHTKRTNKAKPDNNLFELAVA